MRVLNVLFTVIAVVTLVLTTAVQAADPGGKVQRKTLEAAGSVDLLADRSADIVAMLDSADLKLPENIGELIDKARLSGDPSDSWALIELLHSAELASGKTSELVSARQLADEAVEKARAAEDPLALYSAAVAYRELGDDAQYQALLEEYNALLAVPPPSKAGPSSYDLVVFNWRDEPLDVYLNGDYLGTVAPGYHTVWWDRYPVYSNKHIYIDGGRYYWEDDFYPEPFDEVRYDVN